MKTTNDNNLAISRLPKPSSQPNDEIFINNKISDNDAKLALSFVRVNESDEDEFMTEVRDFIFHICNVYSRFLNIIRVIL